MLLGTFIPLWFWGCLLQSQDHPHLPCLVNDKGSEKQGHPLVWSASCLQAEGRGQWRSQKGKTPAMLQPTVQLEHRVNEWNFKQSKSYLIPDNESSPAFIFKINMIIFALNLYLWKKGCPMTWPLSVLGARPRENEGCFPQHHLRDCLIRTDVHSDINQHPCTAPCCS